MKAAALVLAALLTAFACAPTTQSPADAVTLASEAGELQGCIDTAKATDGGLAYYHGCADAVKRRYHDGGTE